MYNPDTLTLRIDKREAIRWPHKVPMLINGLELQDNHLVVLTSDGKRIQSFRFKFSEDDDARLCIYFDGYQGGAVGEHQDRRLVQSEDSGLLAINRDFTH
jgi:hypothetical protein